MIFIDTNVAIALRDVDPETHRRIALLDERPVLSMITRIELENGASRDRSGRRRLLLDALLDDLAVEMFTHADISAYAAIIAEIGHSRKLTLDRLIAAQAIARDATLITRNGKDFRGVPGLKLIEWPTP